MFQPIDHVSVSPTDGIGPTQKQRKTLTRVGPGWLGLWVETPALNMTFYHSIDITVIKITISQ